MFCRQLEATPGFAPLLGTGQSTGHERDAESRLRRPLRHPTLFRFSITPTPAISQQAQRSPAFRAPRFTPSLAWDRRPPRWGDMASAAPAMCALATATSPSEVCAETGRPCAICSKVCDQPVDYWIPVIISGAGQRVPMPPLQVCRVLRQLRRSFGTFPSSLHSKWGPGSDLRISCPSGLCPSHTARIGVPAAMPVTILLGKKESPGEDCSVMTYRSAQASSWTSREASRNGPKLNRASCTDASHGFSSSAPPPAPNTRNSNGASLSWRNLQKLIRSCLRPMFPA